MTPATCCDVLARRARATPKALIGGDSAGQAATLRADGSAADDAAALAAALGPGGFAADDTAALDAACERTMPSPARRGVRARGRS